MFIQIHMLQSLPPSNVNRDDTGQPKKCVFGGVTRGRISSQCLKRNIRCSPQFKKAFGEDLATRTLYLPRMVADALKGGRLGVPDDDLDEVMGAIASKFKRDRSPEDVEGDGEDAESTEGVSSSGSDLEKTGQLVFFPPPYALRVAELVAALRRRSRRAYERFIGRKLNPKPTKDEEKALKSEMQGFIQDISRASEALTVDVALFGRMTTSDLVVDVDATCQVAHAISTHETLIESDYFTAMDDRKADYASTQTERTGAAFLGSGDTETYYDSAVYYKYFNIDTDALRDKKHMPSLSLHDVGNIVETFVIAAAFTNPTGKQNSFAAHSANELILLEASEVKRPLSHANAFLQPVYGPNLMSESAKALSRYIDSVSAAYAPSDTTRSLLAVGNAALLELQSAHSRVNTIDELVKWIAGTFARQGQREVAK